MPGNECGSQKRSKSFRPAPKRVANATAPPLTLAFFTTLPRDFVAGRG
jgi:hypothetical protein